jgi:radical SAM superfamily enzyme YgiQ (UPF0313 family)
MRALLVYPEFPKTYWGLQYTLPIVRKGAVLPPLGLITLAAHLPNDWDLRLIDLNFQALPDSEILWADLVLVSGMRVQTSSIRDVLRRCTKLGRRTMLGGPAATASPDEFRDANYVFAGEIEGRVDQILTALESSTPDKRQFRFLPKPQQPPPSLSLARVPRFDLLDLKSYTSMSVQYSRGCPFSCEFCDVIELFGRVPRVKSSEQILMELEALYDLGYRGTIFFVDDNFIGNAKEVRSLLPRISGWQRDRDTPFSFYTEASLNLAADPALIKSMIDASFTTVFLGIESPSKQALADAGKKQNLKNDPVQAIDTLTRAGLEVMGGFIVGFDSDTPEIFKAQLDFIGNSPIPLAMIGLLIALPGTALWRRLEKEGRLRTASSGDPFGRSNFVPSMNEEALLEGYANLLSNLYTADAYFNRCHEFLRRTSAVHPRSLIQGGGLAIFLNALLRLGIIGDNRAKFWRLLIRAIWKYRADPTWGITWAVGHAIQGEHFIRYTRLDVLPRMSAALRDLRNQTKAA